MSSAQPAFGAMFRELIELSIVEIDTEPLDVGIERRLKEFWKNTSLSTVRAQLRSNVTVSRLRLVL